MGKVPGKMPTLVPMYFCMHGSMNSEQINLFAHSYTISLIFRLMWEGEISYQMSIVMAVKSD